MQQHNFDDDITVEPALPRHVFPAVTQQDDDIVFNQMLLFDEQKNFTPPHITSYNHNLQAAHSFATDLLRARYAGVLIGFMTLLGIVLAVANKASVEKGALLGVVAGTTLTLAGCLLRYCIEKDHRNFSLSNKVTNLMTFRRPSAQPALNATSVLANTQYPDVNFTQHFIQESRAKF